MIKTPFETRSLPSGAVAVLRDDEVVVVLSNQAAADRAVQGFHNVEHMVAGPLGAMNIRMP